MEVESMMGSVTFLDPATEIKIEVPWGHISAKTWGNPSASPVLCVHGIQDNANSFDTLIPLLPKSFYYVAIDLPGHGRSSSFSDGTLLQYMEYMFCIPRVIDFLGWTKCLYIGHSLGGQIGFLFASFFPEKITKLVILDSMFFHNGMTVNLLDLYREKYEKLFELEKRLSARAPPEYTQEEAVQRLVESRPSDITREGALVLLQRGIVESGNGYSFSADQRLKLRLLIPFTESQVLDIVSHIRCPLIVFRSSELDAYSQGLFDDYDKMFRSTLGSAYCYKVIQGTHDFHLLHPERVAPDIEKFMLTVPKSAL